MEDRLLKRGVALMLAVMLVAGTLPANAAAKESLPQMDGQAVLLLSEVNGGQDGGNICINDHNYTAVVTEPTCTKKGYTTHTCVCGDSYRDSFVEPTGKHTYSNSSDESCNVCGARRQVLQSIYRLYNPYTHEHLLSGNESEKDQLINVGWKLDGIAWKAPGSGIPVYRLYNPYDDWHTYTISQEEIDMLVPLGWTVDGVVTRSADAKEGTPIYRLFNPYEQKNYHLFTASKDEVTFLTGMGWVLEGVAWYGLT